jgi:predicted acetyltransferase
LMAACEARVKGYRVAVLTASPFGFNIYRRLGFHEYCTVSTYEWSPEEIKATNG